MERAQIAAETIDAQRRSELAGRLRVVRDQIADAARSAMRSPDDVTLVVVTKRFPASDVQVLADLGVTDVGENRHPEARDKAADLSAGLRWHYIGQLQTNKANAVARYIDQVDSVDREQLVTALDRAADNAGRRLDCLVQVSLAADPQASAHRGGCPPADLARLCEAVQAAEHLTLRGVMGMAEPADEPEVAFARLARAAEQVQRLAPAATEVSGGMSGDFPAAIQAGSTHVRIGTAILGERQQLG